jgi:hypothetical protein
MAQMNVGSFIAAKVPSGRRLGDGMPIGTFRRHETGDTHGYAKT